jgi:adenosylmethionine-8-amino-7-oxononanoate aminotransferase
VEFVADRATKTTLDPAAKTHAKLKATAKQNGLLVYPMGGTVDGIRGDHALLAPPFICTESDISQIVERFAQSVREVMPV